jgi:hypothetical protein
MFENTFFIYHNAGTDGLRFQPVFHLGEGANTETQKLEKFGDEKPNSTLSTQNFA